MLVLRKRTSPAGRRSGLAFRTAPAAALAVAAAATVAACGSSSPAGPGAQAAPSSTASGNVAASGSGLCGAATKVDSLTVQRSDALPGNHARFTFPATEKVSSAPRTQSVVQSLCALPPVAHMQVACPADFGITYRLTFVAGDQQYVPVTVSAAGCEMVHGLGQVRQIKASDSVWRQLGVAIGIPHPNQATFAGTTAGAQASGQDG
jgi:hypothetical protein